MPTRVNIFHRADERAHLIFIDLLDDAHVRHAANKRSICVNKIVTDGRRRVWHVKQGAIDEATLSRACIEQCAEIIVAPRRDETDVGA